MDEPIVETTDTPKGIDSHLRELVKGGLITAKDTVKAAIISALVKEEMEKRTKATTAVFEQVESTQLEIRKIKPSYVGYTLDNKPIGEPFYSKADVESTKKLGEKLAKFRSALDKALNDNDFSKVFELANQGK